MPKPQVKYLTTSDFIKKYGDAMFTSEGIRRGLKMESELPKAHELKAEEINAIRQTQSKGFRIIDIDPNQLDRFEYYCSYTEAVLNNLVGQDYAVEDGVRRFDNTGAATPGSTNDPYWRTVNIPISGNFLKIEYLPARPYDGGLSSTATFNSPDGIVTSTIPQNTNAPDEATFMASKRVMLLDFENITDRPIFVKPGDVYKTYFTNFYLTFKEMNCRIRVTIGSNSEIETSYESPKNLAMWDGGGFIRENVMHPVPFCMTEADLIGSYGGIAVGISTLSYLLIGNQFGITPGSSSRNQNLGVSVMYLTGFTGIGYLQAGGDFIDLTNFELFLAGFDSATLNITTLKKRLASFNTSNYSVGAANGVGLAQSDNGVNFNEPLRVTLQAGECLAVRLIPSYRNVAHNVFCKFQVTGYVVGGLDVLGTRFETPIRFKEHPYPLDNDLRYFPAV